MSFRDDKDARRFLPHRGHWDRHTIVDRKRRLYAVWALAGQDASLMDAADVEANRAADDKLRQSISAPEVELWTHFVRIPGLRMRGLPPVPTYAGARLDEAYRSRPANARLYDQHTFVTAVMRPRFSLETAGRALFDPPRLGADMPDIVGQDFDNLCAKVQDAYGRYTPRRLGLREGEDGAWYSDVFGAWHAVANCRLGRVPVSTEDMGRLIVPMRPEFGDTRSPDGAFIDPTGPRAFALLTFLRYPARVSPLMFDDLRELRGCGVVITNAERFVLRQKAADKLDTKMNTKESAQGRAARRQLQQMEDEREDIEAGDAVPVTHHFSVAVHAHTMRDLDRAVAAAQRAVDGFAVLHRQDVAVKATFYGQIPGNFDWSTASAPTTSGHTAAFAAPNSVSRGHDAGRWGAPVLVLRTETDTEYPFHLHVPGGFDAEKGGYEESDRGNIRISGPPGSGKTVLLNALVNGALRVSNSRVFCVDNRLGMSVHIEAQGGSYAEAIPGVPFLNLLAGQPRQRHRGRRPFRGRRAAGRPPGPDRSAARHGVRCLRVVHPQAEIQDAHHARVARPRRIRQAASGPNRAPPPATWSAAAWPFVYGTVAAATPLRRLYNRAWYEVPGQALAWLGGSGSPRMYVWSLVVATGATLVCTAPVVAAAFAPGVSGRAQLRRAGEGKGLPPERANSSLHGDTAWMQERDMRRLAAAVPRHEPSVIVGAACRLDLHPERNGADAPLLRVPVRGAAPHGLIYTQIGGGKTSAVTGPNLDPHEGWQGSVLVHDPSSQAGAVFADARRSMGQRVVFLGPPRGSKDPDRRPRVGIRLFAGLDSASPGFERDVRTAVASLGREFDAKALSGENGMFKIQARALQRAVLADMLSDPETPASERTPLGLFDRLCFPEDELRGKLEEIYRASPSPMARRIASRLMRVHRKTFGSILSDVSSNLDWLEVSEYAELVSGTAPGSIAPDDFVRGEVSLFLQLGLDAMKNTPQLGRAVLNALAGALLRADGRGRETLLLLDERVLFGDMEALSILDSQGRKYGVTVVGMWQNPAQTELALGKEGARVVQGNAGWEAYSGMDPETAHALSERLGKYTVLAPSEGVSSSHGGRNASSHGRNHGTTLKARPLATPEELQFEMRPEEQILFVKPHPVHQAAGVPPGPMRCAKAFYYLRPAMAASADPDPYQAAPTPSPTAIPRSDVAEGRQAPTAAERERRGAAPKVS